ncbi:MAG TPA: CvpA family protein, partial [Candidatus Dormibacteraeota bacterium]|nr:CvpA family protein [Candidatus Dormibacteraeota bacterium]
MTIWLLGLLMLASLAGLGFRQGAIRVAFSFVGIILGALLAAPLGHLIKPLFPIIGMKDPLLLAFVPPLIVFILISAAFKVAALQVHHKVDVHYKYQTGELRLALWERVHHRLGLCLGLFNGTLYFLLLCWAILALSYWTVQTATADSDPWYLRLINRMGKDLNASGFAKAAKSIDRLPETYYQTADIAALIYNNPLLEARLSRYPAFLDLGQRREFQDLANDKGFTELRQRQEPILNLIKHPAVQGMLENRELMESIHKALVPNLKDLKDYLVTGRSAKFDPEVILGRWQFNLNYT